MEWIETTGRTIEEALEAALDQLGIDERDAEVEVVEEAKTGLFGRLRSEARIRARVRPTRPRPKAERPERSRRRASTKAPAQTPAKVEASGKAESSGKAEEAKGPAPRKQATARTGKRRSEEAREDDDVMDAEGPLDEQA